MPTFRRIAPAQPGSAHRKQDRRYQQPLGALASGVAAVALVAACGSGAAYGPAATPPAASAPSASAPGATQVPVTMTDFHLALPTQALHAGTYTFVAANAGKTVHSLVVDGPGVAGQRIPGVVQPGRSAELTVTLQPGSYEMYCPVGGHKALGMDVQFTVAGGGSTAAAPPPAPASGGGGGGY